MSSHSRLNIRYRSARSAGILPHMSELSSASRFLEWVDRIIVHRAGPKLSDRAVSMKATGKADTLRSIRRNVNDGKQQGVSSETIRKFEEFLGVTFKDTSPPKPKIIRPSGPEPSEVEKVSEGWPNTGERTVNVRGVAVGGDDGFFYFGDVIDRVKRPPGIANAKDVEALNVAGESMVPRFGPGELIYIQLRPPAPGDDIVVELYPEKDGDQPKGFLKRLVRRTGLRLYCQQFNPPADIEFDMGEVKNVWRVLTLRDLLG